METILRCVENLWSNTRNPEKRNLKDKNWEKRSEEKKMTQYFNTQITG